MRMILLQGNPSDLHALGAQFTIGACLGSVAKAFNVTNDAEYLELARTLIKFLEMPGCGDLLRKGLTNQPLHKNPVKSWHGLVTLDGIAQLSQISEMANAADLRMCAVNSWWSLCEHERSNNGAILAGEKASGLGLKPSPDAPKTSAAVAWTRLTMQILDICDQVVVADELELTLFNAGLYTLADVNTGRIPVNGTRHESKTPANPASLDVAWGPCMFAALGTSSVKCQGNLIKLNLYYAGHFKLKLESGNDVQLKVETQYPYSNQINITVVPSRRGELFPIALRIPSWSSKNSISVDLSTANQPEVSTPDAGTYVVLEKSWCSGDRITIELDFALRFCKSETGQCCIYRGPVLLAYDPALQTSQKKGAVPTIATAEMSYTTHVSEGTLPAMIMSLDISGSDDDRVTLCDYASAGMSLSSSFSTWLPVTFKTQHSSLAFSKTNPTRTFQIASLEGGYEKDAADEDEAPYILCEPSAQKDPPGYAKVPGYSPLKMAEIGKSKSSVGGLADKFSSIIEKQSSSDSLKSKAAAPAVEVELANARAFQQSLRKAKQEAEQKANQVAQESKSGAFPFASARKASTRNMLREALGSPNLVRNIDATKPSHDADALLLRSSSYEVATSRPGINDIQAAEGDGYELASGHEYCDPISKETMKKKESASELKLKFEEVQGPALVVKRSWRKPWRKNVYDEEGKKLKGEARKSMLREMTVKRVKDKDTKKNTPTKSVPEQENSKSQFKTVTAAKKTQPRVAKGKVANFAKSSSQPNVLPAANSQTSELKTETEVPPPAKKEPEPKAELKTAPVTKSFTIKPVFGKGAEATKPPVKTGPIPPPTPATPGGTKSYGASDKCYICTKTVYAMEKGEADGMVFHKKCFRCTECKKIVGIGKYASLEGKIYCKTHFKQLFKLKGNYNEGFGTEQHKKKWLAKDGEEPPTPLPDDVNPAE